MRFHISVVAVLSGLLVAGEGRAEYEGYYAPTTIVDMLQPTVRTADIVAGMLAERKIATTREGDTWKFQCLPETVLATYTVRSDGHLGRTFARFALPRETALRFHDLLISAYGREGKGTCAKTRCKYVNPGFRVEFEIKRDGKGTVLEVSHENTTAVGEVPPPLPDPTPEDAPEAEPEVPASEVSAPAANERRYANGAIKTPQGELRRAGDLPPDAPPGMLAGIWSNGDKVITFFPDGTYYQDIPNEGMNVLFADSLHVGTRGGTYEVKGARLFRTSFLGHPQNWELLQMTATGRAEDAQPFSWELFRSLANSPQARLIMVGRAGWYRRLDLCPDRWLLAGSWQMKWANVDGGVDIAPSGFVYEDSAGNQSNTRSGTASIDAGMLRWTFGRDGRVVLAKSTLSDGYVSRNGVTAPKRGAAERRGTYTIVGCELTVSWADGKSDRYFLNPKEGSFENPTKLLIAPNVYDKVQQ